MLRLVLILTVLTHGLTLAASPAAQDCADMVVHGKNSTQVKTFNSKEGKLLFFPVQGFEAVTIKLAAAGKMSTQRISREDLCVNSTQWYSLEVKVRRTLTRHWCSFKTNYCNGKCGMIRDFLYDDFQSFSVEDHGASFWSRNNTGQATRCTTPIGANIKLAADNDEPFVANTTPAAVVTHSPLLGVGSLSVWLVGIVSGAVVLVALTVAYIARRLSQPFCSRKRQQEMQIRVPTINTFPVGCNNTAVGCNTEMMMSLKDDPDRYALAPHHACHDSTHNKDIYMEPICMEPIYMEII